jgi:hypothetical protein
MVSISPVIAIYLNDPGHSLHSAISSDGCFRETYHIISVKFHFKVANPSPSLPERILVMRWSSSTRAQRVSLFKRDFKCPRSGVAKKQNRDVQRHYREHPLHSVTDGSCSSDTAQVETYHLQLQQRLRYPTQSLSWAYPSYLQTLESLNSMPTTLQRRISRGLYQTATRRHYLSRGG